MIGKTVAQYEILEQLGMGGMGIVYKAKDTNLGRIVALKFLPQNTLVSDDDKARFRREAQAAASLNHPNICTIHDLGQTEDGNTYIAMEYVDGPTLRHEIEKSPMKLDRAISITVQIAKGLQAAHSVNIVHRDVKSVNIMLNAEGQVKIMDFGLAKTSASTQLTKTGSTLGTFTFMSPEQARGDQVDHRTDIWSLGVVLYELVTGRLPFGGEYEQAMVYSILNQDPEPLTSLRVGVPVALDWIMAKLLSKDPARRYQSASEAAIDLESIDLKATGLSSVSMISGMSGVSQVMQPAATAAHQAPATAVGSAPTSAESSLSLKRLIPIGVALTIIAAALGWFLKPTPPDPPGTILRYQIPLPADITFSRTGRYAIALSPDGAYYAFRGNDGIYLGRLDSREPANLIRDTGAVRGILFSPDSRWLAFEDYDSNRLLKVSVTGGSPIPIATELHSVTGASWSENGWLYYGQGPNGIFRVPENGGPSESVVVPDSASLGDGYYGPQLLPGGDRLLYTRIPSSSNDAVDYHFEVRDLNTDQFAALPLAGSDARYLSSGHLVYGFGGAMYAAAFNPNSLKVGSPVPVIDGIMVTGPLQSSATRDGLMAWVPGDDRVGSTNAWWRMVWVDGSGSEEPIFSDQGRFAMPKISPDGARIAVIRMDAGDPQVWVYDIARGAPSRLTPTISIQFRPIWSPDGSRLAFSGRADQDSESSIWVTNANDLGSTPEVLVALDDMMPESWSPDSRFVAYTQFTGSGDIFIYDTEAGTSTTFLATAANEFESTFSPDGKWLAYASDVTGQFEVYVRPFPSAAGEYLVSVNGGSSPVWSSDGQTIYYRNPDDAILSVNVNFGPTPSFGTPGSVYEGDAFAPGTYQGAQWGEFDMDRKNSRFIMMMRPADMNAAEQRRTDQINVVVNWSEELKRLVPPIE